MKGTRILLAEEFETEGARRFAELFLWKIRFGTFPQASDAAFRCACAMLKVYGPGDAERTPEERDALRLAAFLRDGPDLASYLADAGWEPWAGADFRSAVAEGAYGPAGTSERAAFCARARAAGESCAPTFAERTLAASAFTEGRRWDGSVSVDEDGTRSVTVDGRRYDLGPEDAAAFRAVGAARNVASGGNGWKN